MRFLHFVLTQSPAFNGSYAGVMTGDVRGVFVVLDELETILVGPALVHCKGSQGGNVQLPVHLVRNRLHSSATIRV